MPPAETPSKAVAQLLFMMKLGSSSGLGDAALEPRVQEAGGSAKRPPRRGKTPAGMKVERVAGNDSGAQRHSQGIGRTESSLLDYWGDDASIKTFSSSDSPLANLKESKRWESERVVGCSEKQVATNDLTDRLILYIFKLPPNCLLPLGLHLSRDHPYTDAKKPVTGHHTLNAGKEYVDGPLKEANELAIRCGSINYSLKKVADDTYEMGREVEHEEGEAVVIPCLAEEY